jgi:hypothetical protein
VIFNGIYKLLHFRSRFRRLSSLQIGPRILYSSPCKRLMFYRPWGRIGRRNRRIPVGRRQAMVGRLKDRYGEPERRGSEWEPIKILLEGDGNSNKMNAASNTLLQLTTQVGQAHVATRVPLDLGTNTQPSDSRTQRNTKPRVYRPTPVRPVSTTDQTGPCW